MSRPRVTQLTIRARLTLVYGLLFVLAGVALLGVTYLLVAQQPLDSANLTVSGQPSPGTSHVPQPGEQPSGPATQPATEATVEKLVSQARRNTLTAVLTQGGIALTVVGAAAVALGWLLAGQLIQPLHRITETARRIADTPAADRGLHERIALDGPRDEVKELADTFDVMLERLDHSFDSQRRFIANASHELRTPLTLNRALLEVAVHRKVVSPEVYQLVETLLAINTRHEQLIDGLLLLARSEREITDRSYVDLADIVEHVAAQVPSGTVTVQTEAGEAATNGNPVLLERLVQNLLDNGVRHNVPEDGWVSLTSGTRSDGIAVLRVSNTGPVVPRYEIPSLFEPFRRLGTDRVAANAAGAGLGLSIVRAIARAHGGDVRAEPRDGGGLIVTVTLPAGT